jgi:ATP-dependent Lhr-like helicase
VGPKTESLFGRRNFMELYAVFTSPQSYTVITQQGRSLGTLSQDFVDRLVDEVSCFLLGGQAWAVLRVSHDDRRVTVERAPRGKQPTWGGYLPQFLGRELCERMRQVLESEEDFAYLDAAARVQLQARRDEMAGVFGSKDTLEVQDDELRWWTFAGGRINQTLRHALLALQADWKVIPDNLLIRIRGANETAFREALATLKSDAFWNQETLWKEVAEQLPSYRLSKFQPLLPEGVVREMLAAYLLDVKGARAWLGASKRADRQRPPVPPPS